MIILLINMISLICSCFFIIIYDTTNYSSITQKIYIVHFSSTFINDTIDKSCNKNYFKVERNLKKFIINGHRTVKLKKKKKITFQDLK